MSLIYSFAVQITGLECDLKEVTRLLEMCERKRVQDVLSQEQKRIEKELAHKQQQRDQQAKRDSVDKTDTTVKGYTVKINNYGVYTLIVLLTGFLCLVNPPLITVLFLFIYLFVFFFFLL